MSASAAAPEPELPDEGSSAAAAADRDAAAEETTKAELVRGGANEPIAPHPLPDAAEEAKSSSPDEAVTEATAKQIDDGDGTRQRHPRPASGQKSSSRLGGVHSASEKAPPQPAPVDSAPRRQRKPSGREIILQANRDANAASQGPVTAVPRRSSRAASQLQLSSGVAAFSTGPHLNGQHLTTAEEYLRFRRRNKVAPGYRGPVYVAEDVQVPCALCGGPLEPITRVPVGNLFFHPTCVHCCVCGLASLTENYSQVRNTTSAMCAACVAKGFEPGERKNIINASQRQQCAGGVGRSSGRAGARGASGGVSYNGSSLYAKLLPAQTNPQTALNQAVLPGAAAPSLTIGPVHTSRNTCRRSFALMQRQQYYTQSDGNMIMSQSMVKSADGMAARSGDGAQQRVSARRQSNMAANGEVPRLQ